MTVSQRQPLNKSTEKSRGWLRKNIHFLVATAVLLVATGWWLMAPDMLKWVMIKKPVTWTDAVEVSDDFRLVSLPRKLGNFEMLNDGEVIHEEDILDALGIGTGYDKARYESRQSNWYVTRMYRDSRKANGAPLSLWQLSVIYYTGALDTVPHVGERCLVAGGATISGSDDVTFNVPIAREPWDGPIVFKRIRAERGDKLGVRKIPHVEYYTFSLNGKPEQSWEKVRFELMKPWITYCYFAKIQIVPLTPVQDVEQADKSAQEFINSILPSVLRMIRMPKDIELLSSSEK